MTKYFKWFGVCSRKFGPSLSGGPGNRISSRAVIRGGVLTFPSVQHSDEGDYTCRAVNTHGEHTARAVLHIYSSPGTKSI